ncbi:unnamed protein product, partial [Mesorhabditis belari]
RCARGASFFSGHSAISVYTAFYAILYLQAKLGRFEPTKIFVSLVQTILLALFWARLFERTAHFRD